MVKTEGVTETKSGEVLERVTLILFSGASPRVTVPLSAPAVVIEEFGSANVIAGPATSGVMEKVADDTELQMPSATETARTVSPLASMIGVR
jgi:hypothetical protein